MTKLLRRSPGGAFHALWRVMAHPSEAEAPEERRRRYSPDPVLTRETLDECEALYRESGDIEMVLLRVPPYWRYAVHMRLTMVLYDLDCGKCGRAETDGGCVGCRLLRE